MRNLLLFLLIMVKLIPQMQLMYLMWSLYPIYFCPSFQEFSDMTMALRIIQARGGAAGCSRQRQEVTSKFCCRDHVVFLTTNRRQFLLPAVFSHRIHPTFCRLYILGGGAMWEKSADYPEALNRTFASTHAPPPEKVGRISGVQ